MQIVRVVIVRVIVDGVLSVMIVVLIGHDEVLANLRSHFCSDFQKLEMYSSHHPVGDSELR